MQHRPNTTVADPPMGGSLSTEYRPVWQILDEARARSFTGEIVMMLEPEVRAYFDNGVVYAAERADEAPIGERLVTGHRRRLSSIKQIGQSWLSLRAATGHATPSDMTPPVCECKGRVSRAARAAVWLR